MNPRPRAPSCAALAFVVLALTGASSPLRAQGKAAPITQEQSEQTPFSYSGRLEVQHGTQGYFGTATYIRRYTALTCGHLLYNGSTGFSTHLVFTPGLYGASGETAGLPVASFDVLSGYQDAADADGDSDAAFARDLGYVLFTSPAPDDNWANWEVNPALLAEPGARMVLGYAAESYPGNVLAMVNSTAPHALLQDGLYESSDYYTQSGMSGGPVYLFDGGVWQVLAETVAGTSPPDPALSDVRAITDEARVLVTEPEYTQGLIRDASLKTPVTVSANSTVKFKSVLNFIDGEGDGLGGPARYGELMLVAAGSHAPQVSIVKKDNDKFAVSFGALPKGAKIKFRLYRDTAPINAQAPLTKLSVFID